MKFSLTDFKPSFDSANKKVQSWILTPSVKKRILSNVGEEERLLAQERIEITKKDPNGRRWQPWSMATIEARRSRGTFPGKGILYEFGGLFRSFKVQVGTNVVAIFSNKPYAKFLQKGTPRMPARPFLGWNRKSIDNVKNKFVRFFKGRRLSR